jgi:SAM-dependent methyltransferase
MVSTALRETARLSRKALATARTGGIAGLARAAGRHLSWRLGLVGYFRWRDGRIDRRAGIDPRQYNFIDFGSGKGRALVLAAEAGFRKVIGVEISPALHEVAIRNVATYRQQRPQAGPIELRCGNATAFELPPGDTLLFFFNPFREATLRAVISNAARAWRQQPRKLTVAYCNPLHLDFFNEFDFLEPAFRDHALAVFHSR